MTADELIKQGQKLKMDFQMHIDIAQGLEDWREKVEIYITKIDSKYLPRVKGSIGGIDKFLTSTDPIARTNVPSNFDDVISVLEKSKVQ